MVQFSAATIAHIPVIQQIAASTWPIAYADILTARQISYMMHMMYSHAVLQDQIKSKGHYFSLLYHRADDAVGFFHINQNIETPGTCKLNKIYLQPNMHGKKLGLKLLQHAEELALSLGSKTMELQVNRNNKAKTFYEQNGYTVLYQDDFDIGAGFLMQDYVMSKYLI